MDIGCTPFLLHGLVYLVQHLCILVSISVKLRDDWKIFCYWLEDILLWLEDRLEDIQFSSLSSSLYSVKSQRVAPILEDMADFFAYMVINKEYDGCYLGHFTLSFDVFMAVVVNRLGGLLRMVQISKPTDLRFALKISRFVKQ